MLATRVGGTHSTGMHSCFRNKNEFNQKTRVPTQLGKPWKPWKMTVRVWKKNSSVCDGEITAAGANVRKTSHFAARPDSYRDITRFCRGECHGVTGAKGYIKPAPRLAPSCTCPLAISRARPPLCVSYPITWESDDITSEWVHYLMQDIDPSLSCSSGNSHKSAWKHGSNHS